MPMAFHLDRQITTILLVLFAPISFAVSRVQASAIYLTTTPTRILPFEAEARIPTKAPTIVLKITGSTNAKLHLNIRLPAETPWLSTDFPIVEGKTLLDIETPIPKNGSLSLKPMLPIRGDYTIPVELKQNNQVITNQVFKLHVNENSSKYWHFTILVVLLFAIGLAGGWIISGKQQMQPGQLAPTQVEVLLSAAALVAIFAMLALAISAEMNIHNHCQASHIESVSNLPMAQNGKFTLTLTGTKGAAAGDLASFQLQVKDTKTSIPNPGIAVHIKATQLEDNFPTLSFTGITDEAGQIAWHETFFDGAPHQIEATLGETTAGLRVCQTVDVEPIHPPLARRLTSFAYMVAGLIAGLMLPFIIRRRQRL